MVLGKNEALRDAHVRWLSGNRDHSTRFHPPGNEHVCLYNISINPDPLPGKLRFITTVYCTGIAGRLVSLWRHTDVTNSAGASGAVFGLYGVFLALLNTKLVPEAVRKSLLQSIIIFIGYNLVYGMKSGVDNAAHAGGFIKWFRYRLCIFRYD